MNISKLKKQEMLDILNNTYNLNFEDYLLNKEDLKYMMSLYKRGYIIKSVHDLTYEEEKNSQYITYGLRAITTNKKPKELKEYCLKVKLEAEGNYYIKATSLESAKQLIKETPFLNKDLTNIFLPTNYKKTIIGEV